MPIEARRGCWIPWKWSYKWLCAVTWVLRTEPGSSGRAASALNHWAISPAPLGQISMTFLEQGSTRKYYHFIIDFESSLAELGALRKAGKMCTMQENCEGMGCLEETGDLITWRAGWGKRVFERWSLSDCLPLISKVGAMGPRRSHLIILAFVSLRDSVHEGTYVLLAWW